MSAIRRRSAAVFLSLIILSAQARSMNNPGPLKEKKPYKILTAGRQLTIQCNKEISHVMVWTTRGNRVVEQKDIRSTQYRIDIPVNQKTFFLMIGTSDGKIYTEKIGVP